MAWMRVWRLDCETRSFQGTLVRRSSLTKAPGVLMALPRGSTLNYTLNGGSDASTSPSMTENDRERESSRPYQRIKYRCCLSSLNPWGRRHNISIRIAKVGWRI
jgi:hypothetical protein